METSSALFFIDTAGCSLYETTGDEGEGSKGNEGESEIVLAHIKELLLSGVASKDIAVIAPYNLQVRAIREGNRFVEKNTFLKFSLRIIINDRNIMDFVVNRLLVLLIAHVPCSL